MRVVRKPKNNNSRKYSEKRFTIDEKIALFEEYLKENPDGEIITTTTYKGYTIGRFLIGIRHELNMEEKQHKYSKENVERLANLGLLDDRIDSTINEKIDRVVDFVAKYPQLWDTNKVDYKDLLALGKHVDEFLDKHKEIKEDRQELMQKLKTVEKYYEYIANRHYRGELSNENIEKLKEGKVGRGIGYSKEIEKLAEGQPNEKMFKKYLYLCDKDYDGLDNFREKYIQQIVNTGSSTPVPYIDNLKSIHFDVSSSNLYNEKYDKLCDKIFSYKNSQTDFRVIDSAKLEKLINTILKDQEKEVVNVRYGLEGNKRRILDKTGEILGLKRERVRQVEADAFRKLRKYKDVFAIELDDEARKEFIQTYFENRDIFINSEEKEIDNETREKLKDIVDKNRKGKPEKDDDFSILSLKLSGRAVTALLKLGVKNIDDLSKISKDDILGVEYVGLTSLRQIINKAHARGIKFADEVEETKDVRSILQEAIETTESSSRIGAIKEQMKTIAEIKNNKDNKDKLKKGEENEN